MPLRLYMHNDVLIDMYFASFSYIVYSTSGNTNHAGFVWFCNWCFMYIGKIVMSFVIPSV